MSLNSPVTFLILASPRFCLDASHVAESMDFLQLSQTNDDDMQSKCSLSPDSFAVMVFKSTRLLECQRIDSSAITTHTTANPSSATTVSLPEFNETFFVGSWMQ